MLRRRVSDLLHLELVLLETDVGRHARAGVVARELEHTAVERVEAGERDELEAVAERAERVLEAGDRLVVEVELPVERRRAVVGEPLARVARVDRLGEAARLVEV